MCSAVLCPRHLSSLRGTAPPAVCPETRAGPSARPPGSPGFAWAGPPLPVVSPSECFYSGSCLKTKLALLSASPLMPWSCFMKLKSPVSLRRTWLRLHTVSHPENQGGQPTAGAGRSSPLSGRSPGQFTAHRRGGEAYFSTFLSLPKVTHFYQLLFLCVSC